MMKHLNYLSSAVEIDKDCDHVTPPVIIGTKFSFAVKIVIVKLFSYVIVLSLMLI
jgi:hypothetical protein